MPEFLDLVETIRAEEDSPVRRKNNDPLYQQKLTEATEFVARVYKGQTPVYRLREALTTSDFPLLFGDILDRQLLGNYQAITPIWSRIARPRTVPDFRTVKRFFVDGSEGNLPIVEERAPYKHEPVVDGKYEYAVEKRGRTIQFSWESMVNDDLQALRDIPQRYAKAAMRSEERFATQLYCDANGPDATFYSSGNGNRLAGNPALTLQSLGDAMELMMSQVDADGEPINVSGVTLVVPPGLFVTANNLKNMTESDLNTRGGGNNSRIRVGNFLMADIQVVMNPYIPLVASSANGATSWFLFGSPTIGRPAFEMGFLLGYEAPQIFMKTPNQMRVGGGANVMDGDFYSDSIEYKVRHVFGGVRMDPKSTVASNGSGVS